MGWGKEGGKGGRKERREGGEGESEERGKGEKGENTLPPSHYRQTVCHLLSP
jgi:hypothetical protein